MAPDFLVNADGGIMHITGGIFRGKGAGAELLNLRIPHFWGFGTGGEGRVILHFISYENRLLMP